MKNFVVLPMAAFALKMKFLSDELFDDESLSKTTASSDQDDANAGVRMTPILAQSDPIYGSLGPPAHDPEDHTDEVNFEEKMRQYKPRKMVVDYESMNSLDVAEKITGHKLEMTVDEDTPPPPIDNQAEANAMAAADFELDDDVKSTGKSIKTSIKING